MSHTKLDKDFCDRFDVIAAREGVKVFRSEFEEFKQPAWRTIKEAIEESSIMFLMVGEELVKAQELSSNSPKINENWKHTQNWISYEVGLACYKGMDVWVICDSVKINFPVPYLNNYVLWGIKPSEANDLKWWRNLFQLFAKGTTCPIGSVPEKEVTCINCGAIFNLHSNVHPRASITCPSCLKELLFKGGF
jgi:hypothetical protein